MLGLFVLGSYLNQDGDGYNYRIDGSDAQKFMIELADETRWSFLVTLTRGKKWHGSCASKKLCNSSVFNVAGFQQNWLVNI